MEDDRLREHQSIWQSKPVIRKIYGDYHRRLRAACVPGLSLDVGSGSGHFRENADDVVAIDLLVAPWLDLVADAQLLPFKDGCFDNIVMLDVLHHIERPRIYFSEVTRVLNKGGRLVMIEPAITPISWFVLNFLHPEPVVLSVDPLNTGELTPGRDPFDANQAIPHLLFAQSRALEKFSIIFPKLHVLDVRKLSLFAYPLSEGFKKWSMIPSAAVEPLLAIERFFTPLLSFLLAFRMLIVIERV